MKFGIFAVFTLASLVWAANTLYRDSGVANSGLMPTNAPNVGDVLMVSGPWQSVWTPLTNIVRAWSGTTGGTALPLGSSVFLPPNNTFSTLPTADAVGVTRVPLTRPTILQNLYVVLSAGPGASKTNTITVMTNGAASALAVTMIGTATNASDLTHTVSVPAGTDVGVRMTTQTGSTAGKAAWSFEGR